MQFGYSLNTNINRVNDNLSDGVIYSAGNKSLAIRDRHRNAMLGSRERTELVGLTAEDIPTIHVVEFDENEVVVNLVQIYFDGTDFYFQGVKNSGQQIVKKL